MTKRFEDLFTRIASLYAQYRPEYPAELFEQLAALAPVKELAWDCGTGSGQSACELALHFNHVIASDASLGQISKAKRISNILYLISPSECTGLQDCSVDLVTASQAVHWFDLDAFYIEVKRVLKPGGILAVWCYNFFESIPEIDALMHDYYFGTLGSYWHPRMKLLDDHYRSLPFPFDELPALEVCMTVEWELSQMIGFLHTWSAARAFYEKNGYHPLEVIYDQLSQAWGPPETRRKIQWPLYFRIGRV